MDQGFIDLRANADSASGNDSFWPSFTDIMTVVVMIFMLASTILILRNWDLVAELRATIRAEQEAAELVRSTTEAKATLEERLAQAQHQLSLTRMRLMQAREENQRKGEQMAERDRQLRALETRRLELKDSLALAHRQTQNLGSRVQQLSAELTGVKQAYAQQESRLRETFEELVSLGRTSQKQAQELNELRQRSTSSQQRMAALQGEYDSLKVKYDKLVRPARTAQGKQVVEVRFVKEDGRYGISLKAPGEDERRPVSRSQLEQRLDRLKKRYGRKLYVKIIIPENSGLSYSEAWDFTQEILNQYDYYYQSS
jgi:chromosome segregation ATPase